MVMHLNWDCPTGGCPGANYPRIKSRQNVRVGFSELYWKRAVWLIVSTSVYYNIFDLLGKHI